MTTIPAEEIVGRFGAPFDGTSDDAPGLQAAIDHVLSGGGGRLKLPNADTPVTLATDLSITTPNAHVEIDARGSLINYTGSGTMLSIDFAGTNADMRRPRILGGVWVGTTSAAGAFHLTDTSGMFFHGLQMTDWHNAVLWRLTNDDFWCENNSVIDCRAARFSRFMQFDRTAASAFGSFARTRILNSFAADASNSDYWIYADTTNGSPGVYDSHLQLAGNIGNSATAVIYCGGTWSGTRVDAAIEQNLLPAPPVPAAYFDLSGTDLVSGNAPQVTRVTANNNMTAVVAGQNPGDLTSFSSAGGFGVLNSALRRTHRLTPDGVVFFEDDLTRAPEPQKTATTFPELHQALQDYGLLAGTTDLTEYRGPTANRPTLGAGDVGFEYFDTDLGAAIWWGGTQWAGAPATTALDGDGTTTAFAFNHALNTSTPSVEVFVGGVLITDGWSATITDADNLTVDFGSAPAAGTGNVVIKVSS